MKLTGVPGAVQSINAKAVREGWRDDVTLDGRSMCRNAEGGRGHEYRPEVLTLGQQTELKAKWYRQAQKTVAPKKDVTKGIGPSWDDFERLKPNARVKAHHRMQVLMAVEAHKVAGKTVDYSVELVAATIKEGKSTIYGWYEMVDGLETNMWLPALAPKHVGSAGKKLVYSEEAFDYFCSSYRRLEKPTYAQVYRELKRVAVDKGWVVPSLAALKYRFESEVDIKAVILTRDGRAALKRSYPAQERTRAYMHALEAVVKTDPETLSDLERAARFFYLQRTAFGGKPSGAILVYRQIVPPYGAFIRRYDRPSTLF